MEISAEFSCALIVSFSSGEAFNQMCESRSFVFFAARWNTAMVLLAQRRSVQCRLSAVFDMLRDSMTLASAAAVTEYWIRRHPYGELSAQGLRHRFRAGLLCCQESKHCPGWQMLEEMDEQVAGRDGESLIHCMVQYYLERTRYLVVVLDQFVRDTLRVARRCGAELARAAGARCRNNGDRRVRYPASDGMDNGHGGRGTSPATRVIYLFLRDALVFWPALLARRTTERVGFLAYSRCHHAAGFPPLWFTPRTSGEFYARRIRPSGPALLLDVGIWGSLVPDMITAGHVGADTAILFLATRNPFIEGWANDRLIPHVLDGRAVELLDIVRLVDTVESLLKPFIFVPGRLPHDVVLLSDPISVCCAAVFLWQAYRYSMRSSERTAAQGAEWFELLGEAKSDPAAWCVRRVVPNSSDGMKVLRAWPCGPIAPRDRFCGFAL